MVRLGLEPRFLNLRTLRLQALLPGGMAKWPRSRIWVLVTFMVLHSWFLIYGHKKIRADDEKPENLKVTPSLRQV